MAEAIVRIAARLRMAAVPGAATVPEACPEGVEELDVCARALPAASRTAELSRRT